MGGGGSRGEGWVTSKARGSEPPSLVKGGGARVPTGAKKGLEARKKIEGTQERLLRKEWGLENLKILRNGGWQLVRSGEKKRRGEIVGGLYGMRIEKRIVQVERQRCRGTREQGSGAQLLGLMGIERQ